MTPRLLCRLAVFAALIVPAITLHAQSRQENPTVADVASALRTHRRYSEAVWVLTQAHGAQPRSKMDAVADTLVAIAVGFPGNTPQAIRVRAAAMTGLMLAATGNAGGQTTGTPYPGAVERFMRIAQTAEIGTRAVALQSLAKLPATAQTIAFFRKVASSQDPVAGRAVMLLCNDMGPEGQDVARELYVSGKVTEPGAKDAIDRFAAAHGWQR